MSFRLMAPQVVRVRASRFGGDDTESFAWRLSVAQQAIRDSEFRTSRPITALLRADGPDGWAEVNVAGMLVKHANVKDEAKLVELITGSDAAETLYDFARSHLTPLLAQVGGSAVAPYDSPEPEVKILAINVGARRSASQSE